MEKRVTYLWNCSAENKKALLFRAAEEERTANKILSDALKIYLEVNGDLENYVQKRVEIEKNMM